MVSNLADRRLKWRSARYRGYLSMAKPNPTKKRITKTPDSYYSVRFGKYKSRNYKRRKHARKFTKR